MKKRDLLLFILSMLFASGVFSLFNASNKYNEYSDWLNNDAVRIQQAMEKLLPDPLAIKTLKTLEKLKEEAMRQQELLAQQMQAAKVGIALAIILLIAVILPKKRGLTTPPWVKSRA